MTDTGGEKTAVVKYPRRIIITNLGSKWRFDIEADDGTILDYTLATSRRSAWAMARLSWRRLRKHGGHAR